MATMRYSAGNVVLVRFPFTDLSSSKKRPALIISTDDYHAFRSDCILLLITSQMHDEPYGYAITSWQKAGLLKASFVKPVIMTVESTVVERTLGAIPKEELEKIKAQLFSFMFQPHL